LLRRCEAGCSPPDPSAVAALVVTLLVTFLALRVIVKMMER